MNARACILVDAPNERLYRLWLELSGTPEGHTMFVGDSTANLEAHWNWEIVVVNCGSRDPHVRRLIRHPSRRPFVTYTEV